MKKKIVSHPLFVGAISALIARFLPDTIGRHGGIIMSFLYTYLWKGVWPIWIGLAIALIYWFIRFVIRFRKKYKDYDKLVERMNRLEAKGHRIITLEGEDEFQQLVERVNRLETEPTKIENLKDLIATYQGSTLDRISSIEARLTSLDRWTEKMEKLDEEVNRVIDERGEREETKRDEAEKKLQRKLAGLE